MESDQIWTLFVEIPMILIGVQGLLYLVPQFVFHHLNNHRYVNQCQLVTLVGHTENEANGNRHIFQCHHHQLPISAILAIPVKTVMAQQMV